MAEIRKGEFLECHLKGEKGREKKQGEKKKRVKGIKRQAPA